MNKPIIQMYNSPKHGQTMVCVHNVEHTPSHTLTQYTSWLHMETHEWTTIQPIPISYWELDDMELVYDSIDNGILEYAPKQMHIVEYTQMAMENMHYVDEFNMLYQFTMHDGKQIGLLVTQHNNNNMVYGNATWKQMDGKIWHKLDQIIYDYDISNTNPYTYIVMECIEQIMDQMGKNDQWVQSMNYQHIPLLDDLACDAIQNTISNVNGITKHNVDLYQLGAITITIKWSHKNNNTMCICTWGQNTTIGHVEHDTIIDGCKIIANGTQWLTHDELTMEQMELICLMGELLKKITYYVSS